MFVFERSKVLVAPGRGSLGWTQKERKVEGSDPEQEKLVALCLSIYLLYAFRWRSRISCSPITQGSEGRPVEQRGPHALDQNSDDLQTAFLNDS